MSETDTYQAEYVRYDYQGATFRVVGREVSGMEAVYLQKKRSCDAEFKDERKLGWRSQESEADQGS